MFPCVVELKAQEMWYVFIISTKLRGIVSARLQIGVTDVLKNGNVYI